MINCPLFSPLQPHGRNDHGLLVIINRWMGRLLNTCAQISVALYQLIHKTENAAKPIINQKPQTTPQTPLKAELTPIQKKQDPVIPPPIPTEEPLLNELEVELPPRSSILTSHFQGVGFQSDLPEMLKRGDFYDLIGNRQENIHLENLKGNFHIQWKIISKEPQALIYRGGFDQGTLHGQGSFQFFNNRKVDILLEGRFESGEFVKGLVILGDKYLDGEFKNGKLNGVGTIHRFPTEDYESHYEYRGEVIDDLPHGKGKLLRLSDDGHMEVVMDGEFYQGALEEGRYWYKTGDVYEGKFAELDPCTFKGKGKITNFQKGYLYEGELKENLRHGKGKMISNEINVHEDLVDQGEGLLLEEVEQKIHLIREGEFREDKLYKGWIQISCKDKGWEGKAKVKKGEIVTTTIVKEHDRRTFQGNFDLGTLDGEGSIFNNTHEKVYEGKIKCGFPHGEGIIFEEDGKESKGNFEWGELIEEP